MTTAALRFALAIIVIGFHCGYPIGGPFAVLVFFVLSGGVSFLLLNSQKPLLFLTNRIRSLFPPFLVVAAAQYATLVVLNAQMKTMSIESAGSASSEADLFSLRGLLNLFIPYYVFDYWPLRLGAGSRILPIFWTVLNELHYYTAAALLIAIGFQKRRLLRSAIAGISLVLLASLALASRNDLGAINSYIYFNTPSGFVFFLVGFYTLKSLRVPVYGDRTSRIGGLWTAISIILTLTVLMKPIFNGLKRISADPSMQWMMFALVVAFLGALHLLESRRSFVEGRLRSSTEIITSRSAYFLYLWQVPLLTLIGAPTRVLPTWLYYNKLTIFLFVLSCTIVISVSHASIEHQIKLYRTHSRIKQ